MKRISPLVLVFILIVGVIFCLAFYHKGSPPTNYETPERFAVSWMTSWATTGEIMAALTRTNIPEIYNSTATFPHFLFGPDMNEAAISGNVDATNTGIVPTINLLAADDDWIIVSRLIYFPVALVVPEDSNINSIDDLAGHSVGVPFGGGSHPYLLQRLEEHNLSAGVNEDQVRLINLKPPEQPIAFSRGDVDAVATWEPQTALAKNFKGRIIDRDIHVGFLSVRKSLATQHPQAVVNLLKAYQEAIYFVSQNRNLTEEWFVEISSFDSKLHTQIEVIEPNFDVESIDDIDMTVSSDDIGKTQRVADIMYENDLTPRRVIITDRIDLSYLKSALAKNSFTEKVKVVRP